MQLGARYRDKITGFTGVATGYVQYLTGCNQVLLQPESKDGTTFAEAHWFDEQRLYGVAGPVIKLDNRQSPGFDKAAPKR